MGIWSMTNSLSPFFFFGKIKLKLTTPFLSISDLPSTIPQSELLRQKRSAWPPLDTNLAHDPSGRGLAGVMDDEMGFVD